MTLTQRSNDYITLGSSNRNFLIELWNATNNIVTYWVWENAIRLDTYYFWNKQKLIDKKYNALYTTLLWWEYWDITTKDYLASGMLFNKDNENIWFPKILLMKLL